MANTNAINSEYMTVQEAATFLGVTVQRVHQLIQDGWIRFEKIGTSRMYLVKRVDVDEYAEARDRKD